MDNFHIDVTCEGKVALRLALDLAFRKHSAATHYAIRQDKEGGNSRMVLMWTEGGKDAVALPFTLDAEGATDFVWRWLEQQDFGAQPDHDGDNGKGWRAYCQGWGHVDNEYQGFVAVNPAWAMYGK